MKNYPKANIDILCHILKYCDNIENLINRFGNSFDVFKNDIAFRDSVSMNILQIGELTSHLSDDYRQKTIDKMPWPAMKAMRNLFAHNYGQMNIEVIWATAIENIPQVKEFCKIEIANNPPSCTDDNDDIDI